MIDRVNENELLRDAKQLRDEELLAGLARLLRSDHALTARLLVHIGEIDARGLYREQAYASMFEYAVDALHMSESEAFTRIRAARLSRAFPVVLGMIAKGELHLSAVKLLAPVLTQENCKELLHAARFKSKRQIEGVLAQWFPKADVPNVIRKLPAKPSAEAVPATVRGELALAANAVPENSNSIPGSEPAIHPKPAPSLQPSSPPVQVIAPLRAERYKVQFTADQRLHNKLKQAQDLLRHQVPDGDVAAVLERALDLLIAERMKRRFALGSKPRARVQPRAAKLDSRHIPHEVRREVIRRDGQRCSYVGDAGKRCEQRGWLEFHHEEPYGRGGEATTANIRTLCRVHNLLLAEHDYGRSFMQRRIAQAKTQHPAGSLAPESPGTSTSAGQRWSLIAGRLGEPSRSVRVREAVANSIRSGGFHETRKLVVDRVDARRRHGRERMHE